MRVAVFKLPANPRQAVPAPNHAVIGLAKRISAASSVQTPRNLFRRLVRLSYQLNHAILSKQIEVKEIYEAKEVKEDARHQNCEPILVLHFLYLLNLLHLTSSVTLWASKRIDVRAAARAV